MENILQLFLSERLSWNSNGFVLNNIGSKILRKPSNFQGNTKVLAAVYGPREARSRGGGGQSEAAVVNCQYSMAVFRQGFLTIKLLLGAVHLVANRRGGIHG